MIDKIENIEKQVSILQKDLNVCQGEYNYLEKNIKDSIDKTEKQKILLEQHKKCIELLQLVSGVTREKTQKQFEDLITVAMQYVFGDGYCFKLIFDRRGNLSTLDFKIVTPEYDEASDPLDSESGGLLDLISLILRVVLMETNNPRIEGFLLLDEPLKGLDKERLPKAIEFIKQLSDKLNRQIILISHLEGILDNGFNKISI